MTASQQASPYRTVLQRHSASLDFTPTYVVVVLTRWILGARRGPTETVTTVGVLEHRSASVGSDSVRLGPCHHSRLTDQILLIISSWNCNHHLQTLRYNPYYSSEQIRIRFPVHRFGLLCSLFVTVRGHGCGKMNQVPYISPGDW